MGESNDMPKGHKLFDRQEERLLDSDAEEIGCGGRAMLELFDDKNDAQPSKELVGDGTWTCNGFIFWLFFSCWRLRRRLTFSMMTN